ncbi:hypothetical protein sscle_06g051470 [Sclerotinia sclerotiorum 1980 UF-70]|uniref:CCHC-type domain-containing protein n=1 Tax=Sclerotinia sclerotiorum (strain ATCC 18683 / 1980 / Ss-1) TaxID=665079 RepID=A0A1D9Q616_SCLS1|nr:hypothetical protein sscle_06g051470 [Sclerotinia sclerotiorum 1980 UF-70]
MLVLDGYESHESGPFQNYCIEHKIKAVGLPPHSSHLTQPLDVSCFSVLKRAYSKQIEGYIRMHINHISKIEFFIAFNAAYEQAITMENMKAGFRGAGLVPFNPDAVLSRMDIRIRTPTPPSLPPSHMPGWVSQTPHNATEALSQAFLVRSIIARHHSSSPTPIFKATDPLIKGVEYLASTVTILAFENHDLRLANTGLSKRRRAKKTQLRLGGALTIQEANDIISQKEVDVQIKRDRQQNGRNSNREASTNRCCSKCGITGHNARTCSNDNIDPKLLDSA